MAEREQRVVSEKTLAKITRETGIPNPIEEARNQYMGNGFTMEEIGEEMGVSRGTARNMVIQSGVQTRDRNIQTILQQRPDVERVRVEHFTATRRAEAKARVSEDEKTRMQMVVPQFFSWRSASRHYNEQAEKEGFPPLGPIALKKRATLSEISLAEKSPTNPSRKHKSKKDSATIRNNLTPVKKMSLKIRVPLNRKEAEIVSYLYLQMR